LGGDRVGRGDLDNRGDRAGRVEPNLALSLAVPGNCLSGALADRVGVRLRPCGGHLNGALTVGEPRTGVAFFLQRSDDPRNRAAGDPGAVRDIVGNRERPNRVGQKASILARVDGGEGGEFFLGELHWIISFSCVIGPVRKVCSKRGTMANYLNLYFSIT
jgi:hypothetical protein